MICFDLDVAIKKVNILIDLLRVQRNMFFKTIDHVMKFSIGMNFDHVFLQKYLVHKKTTIR